MKESSCESCRNVGGRIRELQRIKAKESSRESCHNVGGGIRIKVKEKSCINVKEPCHIFCGEKRSQVIDGNTVDSHHCFFFSFSKPTMALFCKYKCC